MGKVTSTSVKKQKREMSDPINQNEQEAGGEGNQQQGGPARIKFEFVNRPVLTQADELRNEAYDILADVVWGKSPDANELEAEAGRLLVKAAKLEYFGE